MTFSISGGLIIAIGGQMASFGNWINWCKGSRSNWKKPGSIGKNSTNNAFRNGICRSYRNLFLNFSFHKIRLWIF